MKAMNLKAMIRKAKEDGAPSKPKTSASSTSHDDKENVRSCSEQLAIDLKLYLPSLPPVVGDQHRIGNISSVWLVEDWLPAEAETQLINLLRSRSTDFTQLRGKRTARYGGDVGPPFLPEPIPDFLLQLCSSVGVAAFGDSEEKPNHVLVNHYLPGEGIMPHGDGPLYFPKAAIVSLCSAVTFTFFRDHAHAASGETPSLSVLVPPRSLLVFSCEAYSDHLHSIADRRYDELALETLGNGDSGLFERFNPALPDAPSWATRQLESFSPGACSLKREERYSLTIRHVPQSDHSQS